MLKHFLQYRKLYSTLPEPPPDPALSGSKRLGLRKLSKHGGKSHPAVSGIFLADFKAVVFDMDGVITNTMPYHFDAWLKVFGSIGVKVDCYDVYKREGQKGLTTIKEIFLQRGRPFNLKEAKQLLREKEELFKHTVKIKFIKGSRPFLRKLKKQGFKLGLVTGTSRHEMERILPKGLRNLFDVIITGCEVKRGKPHPEPFERAVKMIGIPKQQVIVIENAPFGITSAKAAGLKCVALATSLPGKYLKQADIIFGSFKELEE